MGDGMVDIYHLFGAMTLPHFKVSMLIFKENKKKNKEK